jgi:Zn-dependent protease with chaperone function
MSVSGTWPLLAFILVPGVFAWWSGRRLLAHRDDAALAERLLARAQHTQRVTLLSSIVLPFAAGPYFWLAVVGVLVGLWIGDYPSRRVLLDERWTLGTYLGWQLRFHAAWLGFWLALMLAPTAIEAAGAWRWPAAATLALVLGVWTMRYADVFVWLVRARGRLMRPEWQSIVDRSHAARPRLFQMPVPGGRFVNAFAFPSPSAPSVMFTEPALELLSPREQAAVFAHEVAHLEHYDRRRCHLAAAVTGALTGVGTLGAALVLQYLPAGPFIPLWSLLLIFVFLLKTTRHKAHETASDLRALELAEDPEALVSGLTKLTIAGQMPRRFSAELEHGASHPSLARRLHAIRRVAAIPVMPFDGTLVVATERAGALIVLDRDGVSWVEARDARQRDPEILRATARSRWSVPYDELVELRVRAFWWGGASLVARDRSGASRAARIAAGDVAALQRKLDAIEHRLAHDTVTPEPPEALGRLAALGLGLVATLVAGLLSLCLITAVAALIRPSRAALAAVAAVAGACLLVIAVDAGARTPTWSVLTYAVVASVVCAVAAWIALQPRTFAPRPVDYMPVIGALTLVVVLTLGPLLAHLIGASKRSLVAVHLLGGAPIVWATVLALAAAMLTTPPRAVRRAGALLFAGALLAGPGLRLFDTALESPATLVGELMRGTLARTAQLDLPWRVSALRVSPSGQRVAVLTREAARAPDRYLILGLDGGRTEMDARDLRFVDESNAVTLVESATHTRLQHVELAESSTAGWSIALPSLNTPTVSSVKGSGWAVVGYDPEAEEYVGLVGRIGSPGINRYRWPADETDSVDPDGELVAIRPDGRGIRALSGATTLARLPWGGWIYDRGLRWQTRVWRLNGNAQELIAVWPTGAACQLVGTRAADVVCVGEGSERTLIWRFGVDIGPTHPLAVLEVGRRSGVSADGRFVALWGRDALVVVDLDRAQALRRPLPPDVGVPSQLIPLTDRVVALFRRPRTAPVVEIFDTRW